MAQKNRTKEIWLIPKRVNLHQAICLIDGIMERGFDGSVWSPAKQDHLGASLRKWGATKSGKNISAQGLRTLVAYVQYLGFLYIDTTKKSNTIHVTKAGKRLWDTYKGSLVKVKNLSAGKEDLIMKSDLVLRQMEKLQLTNPINAKDCENICLFPFRFLLRVLLEIEYIDQEEIAFVLFHAKKETDVPAVVEKIREFRGLSADNRKEEIDRFLATHIGNITLGQASSAGYFMSLCVSTGIVERFCKHPVNRDKGISALRIKDDCLSYVNHMLSVTYGKTEPFDFGDDLRLWIDYIGDPDRDEPPVEVRIHNGSAGEFLVRAFFRGECRKDDIVSAGQSLIVPMFQGEDYEIRVIDLYTGTEVKRFTVHPDDTHRSFTFHGGGAIPSKTLAELADEVRKHCAAPMFAPEILSYLEAVRRHAGIDRTESKALRGAYLEYDVYRMLKLLKRDGVIDDVIWNGKRGKYGLPSPAPGGKTGIPDLIIVLGNLHIVTELTTISPSSQQFSAEGASVPDHILRYQSRAAGVSASGGIRISGVFSAPLIYTKNTTVMEAALAPAGIPLHCVTVEELLDLFLTKDRTKIERMLG